MEVVDITNNINIDKKSNNKDVEKYTKILNFYYRNFNKCPICHKDLIPN